MNLQSSIGIYYSSIWLFELHKNTSWKLKEKETKEKKIMCVFFYYIKSQACVKLLR